MKLPKQYRSRSRSLSPSKDRFGRSYAPRKTDWEKERREEEEREKRKRDDEEKRLEEEKLRRRYGIRNVVPFCGHVMLPHFCIPLESKKN